MGSNGAHGISKILIGSNAERVSRFSEIPVLIINQKISKIKTVIFASDFEKESYNVFPFVKNFAEIFNADIHLLKVNIYTHYNKSDDLNLLKKFNKKNFFLRAEKEKYRFWISLLPSPKWES